MKPKKNKDYLKKDGSQDMTTKKKPQPASDKSKKVKIIQFLNIVDNSLHQNCVVDVDEPMFSPEPREILFQDYEPLQVLTKVLKLRNRDIVPRRVSIIHPENRLFQIIPKRKDSKSNSTEDENGFTAGDANNTKVAPGMEVSYYIKFTPEAKVDVNYELIVVTEREKFVVPIRGIGCKVKLEFMDFIDFGEVPVKYKVEKPIILRNIGEKITKWMLKSSSQNISVNKKEGILDIGKSEQIICIFCPQIEDLYEETMILSYDEEVANIKVVGRAKNDNVSLSHNQIGLEDAYITLHSQMPIFIKNDTSVPIEFVWKQYPSKDKEDEAKRKVFDNLSRQEAEEKILNELQYDYNEVEGEENSSVDLDDSYDEEERVKILERNHMKSQNIIARRFEKIKKSLNEDQMCYENPNFQIEPLSGKIWPNTRMTITITFKPDQARKYLSEAYCDVTGLDKRLKLEMNGLGIGPKAKLSFPEFNLYDVPIKSQFILPQKLVITNIGVIDCEFDIETPNTPCAKQFLFHIKNGKLKPRGEKETGELSIPIEFHAERLGEFSEKFKVRILKSGAELPLVFKGHVIAPFCKFSKERIDFEKVSLGLDKKESVDLFNGSEVDIKYKLRISTNARDLNTISTIFIIDKTEGILRAGETSRINIAFKPEDERSYEIVLLLDMIDIGFDMLTLPITAVCEIPEVIIEPCDVLDFGNVYIREEKWMSIKLTNTSSTLTSLFQVNPQDEPSKAWGLLFVETESGQIPPEGTFSLNVGIKALRLQKIPLKLEIRCKTKNSNKDSSYTTTINIMAYSDGPKVLVENNMAELDFGTVRVLKEDTKPIYLINDAPIDAVYTAFMKNPNSIFFIKEKTGKIAKKSTVKVEIVCKPDEAQRFSEFLYFKIEEGKDIEVVLKCKGDGTTIVIPNDDIREVNFGTIFTLKESVKEIRFENRGRSDQIVAWYPVKAKKPKALQESQIKSSTNSVIPAANSNANKKTVDEEERTFVLKDPKGMIRSKKYGFFKIIAMSKVIGEICETFAVHNWRDGDNNGPKVWDCVIKANFINPLLTFRPTKLPFSYSYEKGKNDDETVKNTLTIRNSEKLQASFSLNAPDPFRISKSHFIIEPGEEENILVELDPTSIKQARRIDKFTRKLECQHTNHQQVDFVDLLVKINFPNLKDLPTELHFGSLLNDTHTKKNLVLENDSDMEVIYEWSLVELENSYEQVRREGKGKGRKIPLNEVFGIVPMNGILKRGETETVDITFTPGSNQRYTVVARCSVEGGPDYDVKLIGEASDIKYKILINDGSEPYDMSKREITIKLGEIPFNITSKVDMTIKNDGEVPFSYRISYNTEKMRYLNISNLIGNIARGESKKEYIEIIPGIPDLIDDEIVIEIAHFEPIRVKVKAIGVYQGILVTLNRKEPDFLYQMDEVRSFLEERTKKLMEYKAIEPKQSGNRRNVAANDSKKTMIPLNAQYELEVNRQNLCRKLTEKISKHELLGSTSGTSNLTKPIVIVNPTNKKEKIVNTTSFSAVREALLESFMKEIKMATYTCDFGNIVANRRVDLKFDINNYNKSTIQFVIDKKEMSALGYIISTASSNDRIFIEAGSSCTVTITHETNTRNLNNLKNFLKMLMKDGEIYDIELNSFVTIPDLKLSLTAPLEFSKVYIGRKKIMRFRIENTTRVQARWSIVNKDNPPKQAEREERREDKEVFLVSPQSGRLDPGKKQTLTVCFVPGKEKLYQSKYNFVIEEGARPIEFFIKGEGQRLSLRIIPDNVDIGPVLPYYKYALNFVELYNPNDEDIEVYSLDYDNTYLKEEEMLRYYRNFVRESNSTLDQTVRKASDPVWPKFSNYFTKWIEKVEEIRKEIDPSNERELKQFNDRLIDREFADIEEADEIKIPPPIDSHDKVNVVLLGPYKSGKTSLCTDQRKHHFRGIVNMSKLLDWNLENNFEDTAHKARQYLDDRKKEYETIKAEREKLLKMAKTNKKIVVDDTPIDEKKYTYLNKELLSELLKNRLSSMDCNVGTIFEDFYNQYAESEEFLLDVLDEALSNENITLAYLDFTEDLYGQEVCNYVDWHKITNDMHREKMLKKEKMMKDKKSKALASNRQAGGGNANAGQNINNKLNNSTNIKDNKDSSRKKNTNDTRDILTSRQDSISSYSHDVMHTKNSSVTGPPSYNFSSPNYWTNEERLAYKERRDRFIKKMGEIREKRENAFYSVMSNSNNNIDDLKIDNSVIHTNESKDKAMTGSNFNQLSNSSLPKLFNKVERNCVKVDFEYYIPALLESYMKVVPHPKLPDPEDQPLPPDEEYQIIKRPAIRAERQQIHSFFIKSVHPQYEGCTMEEIIQLLIEEEKRMEEIKNKEALAAKDKNKKPVPAKNNPPGKDTKTLFMESEKPKEILINSSRWTIKRGEKVRVIVGFYSKEVGKKVQPLSLEIMTYPPIETKLNLNGIADYPSLSTLPSNIKMSQPGTIGLLNRKRNYEENFGYILVTKDDRKNIEKYKDTNCRLLRFTNNGKFDLRVDFVFLSSLNIEALGFPLPFSFAGGSDMNSSGIISAPKGTKTAPNVDKEPPTPFMLVNNFLEIKKEQTEILRVFTFPSRTVEYKDELICLIKDNPIPIRINLSCKGAEPRVDLESDFLEFEKLIVNQSLTKHLKLRNVSEVTCRWQLNGLQNIPTQFKFEATNGVIEKGKEVLINVTFCSEKQERFAFGLTLDIEDNMGYGVKMPTRTIKFSAEAFQVNVELNLNKEKLINFGDVKVRDYKKFPFSLKNLGIYKIKFKFEIAKKQWQELFKFEPSDGEIEPGKEKNMLAIFLPYAKDINITPSKSGTEIKLLIFEGEKNIKNEEIPIYVNVASYFSKYTINPLKTINYGSMQYGESQMRSIELRNEGTFDFLYELMEYLDESKMKKLKEEKDFKEIEEQKIKEQEMKDELEGLGGKGKPGTKKPNAAAQQQSNKNQKKVEDVLKIGKFSISNFKGVVAPGSTAKIDVRFDAEGNKFYQNLIAIDIQGRHPDDNPLGIPFELVAESCIPGIETKDFDSIFEEQTVLPSLNPELNRQNVLNSGIYSVEEKVFWFGTIIASKNPNGVTERFKLINNNKIPCTLKVEVKPRTISKSEAFSFEVAHKTPLKIYPNESEYVSVTFKPTNVIPYSAIFEAKVEGGELNPDTGKLTFELRGEGTLPTVLLHSPQEFDSDGTPILKFKKTRLFKSTSAKLEVKNWGVVPATVKLEQFQHDCFFMASNSQSVATIQPKEYYSFELLFEPKSEKIEKAVIQYKTLYNPYENQKMYLIGEGYFEPISIDGLVNDIDLNFGDVCIGSSKLITFNISNHSDNPYRFNWLNIYDSLDLSPSTGILLPKTTKTIHATFFTKESVKISGNNLYFELKQIKITNQEESNNYNWDNSLKEIKKVPVTEYNNILQRRQEEAIKRREEMEVIVNNLTGNKNKNAASSQKKEIVKKKEDSKTTSHGKEECLVEIEDVIQEPVYQVVEKTDKYNSIKLSAVSDYVKYQCVVEKIKFKPTTMYGSRKHEFQLRNTSSINMHYNFVITNPNPYFNNNTSILNLSNPMISLDKNEEHTFSVAPKSGVLAPNNDENIRVRFSPSEVDENNFKRMMTCHIKDLDPTMKELQIELSGDAERPICHFELQDGIKQDNGQTVVEFESIGMMVKNTKRFFVLNPTNQGYEFDWEQQDEETMPSINKVFKCLTTKGVIFSGKKFEMIFEYTPNNLGTHQSFWTFRINTGVDSEKLTQKFTFSGIAREPVIIFNVGKVNFGPLLLGGRNKEIIEIFNEEHLPYKFFFDKESIKGNNTYGDSLIVSPIAGTLQPKASTPIEITFMPRVEKEFNYNLVLRVKQRLKPLTLNVKGVGYTINHCVYLDNKQDLRLIPKQEHVIDFGEFFINEKRERKIIIENNGNFNFHFICKKNGADYLTISPDSGTVKKKKEFITLTILPLNKLNLTNHKIFMQIVSGPTYTFLLSAKARSPSIVFSSVSCDFGPCYVMKQPTPNTQIITVKNMDKEALTIETNFDNKNKPYLDVLLSTGQVILPYSTASDVLEIPIVFIPRDFTRYRDVIKFRFNNIYDVDVEVIGEGIPLRVELEDPAMQAINFGIIQLGQNKKMEFVLINRGKIKVNIQLFAENESSFSKKCLNMDIHPEDIVTIEPKSSTRVEVQFNPNIRIPSFQEDIMMKINNTEVKRLISVSGASYGVDVKIVGDIPPFGTVVVNSMAMRQIVLRNTGDLPAKFKWEQPNQKRDYSKFFTFSPSSGVISAHEDFPLDIIFHPKTVENNISFEKIKCFVENTSEPLAITLYGKSIAVPSDSITQNKIITEVRSPKQYEIKIKNTADKLWRITPSISTTEEQFVNYFKGDHTFEIKPGTEGVYILTYYPLTMSKQPNSLVEKEHEATVFFPLPDGSAKVHKVFGVANPPQAKTVAKSSLARQWVPVILDVHNWLFQTQRFKVSWLIDKTDHGIFIKGANTIDVAPDSTKEYKLSFRSWKELQCSITITFENVDTKEYLSYVINMNVTPAEPNPTTELAGVTREIVTSAITITNPLKIPVTIQPTQITCDNDYVTIKMNTPKILPESEMPIEVSFRPLTVGSTAANIFIKSPELGDMKYPLLLKGSSNPQPKSLQPIIAYLGSEKIFSVSFTNYLKKPTAYNIKVDKVVENMSAPIDFIPELPVIQADSSKSTEVTFGVRFEPYHTGRSMALLKATSPDGGEYSWILIGEAYPPQAQGPIKIPVNKAFTLDFKNPMNEAVEIVARFDNPNFSGKVDNRIQAKSVVKIPISFKAGTDQTNTGRLIVTLNSLNTTQQNKMIATWVFYLQTE